MDLSDVLSGPRTGLMHNGHPPTPEQADIFEALNETAQHLIVRARAGTGKTATALEATRRYDGGRTTFLAFNKAIANELKEKVGDGVQAMTTHSLGLRSIYRETDGKVEVDKWKANRIIKDSISADALKPIGGVAEPKRLVSLVKANLVNPNKEEDVQRIIDAYDIELLLLEGVVIDWLPEWLGEMSDETSKVDYDDMIWMPIVNGYWINGGDTIYVDEAQDLNRAQQQLVWKASGGGKKRIVAIGDEAQAIYAFRGADSKSIRRLSSMFSTTERGVTELPLNTTFRCPTSVVDLAKRIVPDYTAAPWAEEGMVRYGRTTGTAYEDLAEGDMVLARKNASLLDLAWDLVSDKRRFMIQGRDVGAGIVKLIERVAGTAGGTTRWDMDQETFLKRCREYRGKDMMKAAQRDDADTMAEIADRFDCITVIARNCASVRQMKTWVEHVFDDCDRKEVGQLILLSSIHRAKGLEADRVWLWDAHDLRIGGLEANVTYVAVTRAAKELHIVTDEPNKLNEVFITDWQTRFAAEVLKQEAEEAADMRQQAYEEAL